MRKRPSGSSLCSLLFTDLYELTMARAYDAEGMGQLAAFELFFRKLPPARNFIVAAGLEDVLDALASVGLAGDELEYLRGLDLFPEAFLERLRSFHFTGEVWAMREGTVVFPHEPLVQVVAPIPRARGSRPFSCEIPGRRRKIRPGHGKPGSNCKRERFMRSSMVHASRRPRAGSSGTRFRAERLEDHRQ